jgi:MFS family permease
MGARLRSWWQKIKRPLFVLGIIAASILVVVMIVGIIGGYFFNWDWTGLGPYTSPPHPKDTDFQRRKTLWDWMQLFFIPVLLGFGAVLLTSRLSKDLKIARDQIEAGRKAAQEGRRTENLQAYLDKMSDILLRRSEPGQDKEEQVLRIAQARTKAILSLLSPNRKKAVMVFLQEAQLLNNINFSLHSADFHKANLQNFNLQGANLQGVNLQEADLSGAKLNGVDLSLADLRGADLSRANLTGARVTEEQLEDA